MRKAKIDPSFMHFTDGVKGGEFLPIVLTGHLVVEALLVDLIQLRRPGDRAWRMNFKGKVDACVGYGFISATKAPLYLRLDDIRNDFAHTLGHELVFDDAFQLVKDMAAVGFDFSDDTIHLDRAKSEEWYGIWGCLIEALNDFYFDLAWILHDNGGPDRLAG